jgi:hypothetical protein
VPPAPTQEEIDANARRLLGSSSSANHEDASFEHSESHEGSQSHGTAETTVQFGELGCFNAAGAWTQNRSECGTPDQQAGLLGISSEEHPLSEEQFHTEAAKKFLSQQEERDAKMAVAHAAIAEAMQRIDDALAQPQNMISEERAVEAKDWLLATEQTLAPENIEIVAQEVQTQLRALESQPIFDHIDHLKETVLATLIRFNEENVALPLEDLFTYQESVSAVDAPECRHQGADCRAVVGFIDALERLGTDMQQAAALSGKTFLLDELQ